MDAWQEEKGGGKRNVFSDPGSSQPIQGQRTRGRTTASGEVVVKLEMKDGPWEKELVMVLKFLTWVPGKMLVPPPRSRRKSSGEKDR